MPDSDATPSLVNNATAIERRKTIGGLIRSIREIAGRKPKDIADFVGISAPALTGIETGEKEASLPQLEAVAYYLRVPVHTLLGMNTLATAEKPPANLDEIIRLRGHIVGARLKQARMTRGESAHDTAEAVGLSSATLQSFEMGKKQPSITELEALMAHFTLTLDDMLDMGIGPLGEAQQLHQQRAQFDTLPAELRGFVCDPKSLPTLHLAARLRNLPPEQLKALSAAFGVLAEQAAAARDAGEAETIG